MLYELFSWIKNSATEPPLSRQIVTRAVFESENKLAIDKRRELIAEVHAARFRSPSAAIVTDAPRRLLQHEEYIEFLKFCSTNLEEHEFLLALKYLLSLSGDNDAKINSIFFALFKENKEKTLVFHSEHQREFDKFKQINLMVVTAELTFQLRAQENPLTIAPLFAPFADDAEKFAAVILWFLHRGITAERILKTNLLQKFMSYHAAWLDASDSPIPQIYKLLGLFPEARELVDEAAKVQCEERGFHCEAGGTRSYSITGVLCEQSALHHVVISSPYLEFTPTEENFEALYKLFGPSFLNDALNWQIKSGDEAWLAALQTALNREATIVAQLPSLINLVGKGGMSSSLKRLASMIDDATIDKLVMRHCGAVLHLLPYKPALLTKIGASDVAHYLEGMKPIDDHVWEVISQLLALLVAFRDSNKPLASQVYEAILDIVLLHPEFLEDSYLMKQLTKFSEADSILTRRCTQLQSQFDRCIAEQVSAGPLNAARYHSIEDTWLDFSRKWSVLKEIIPLASHCPDDKFKLQAHLAKLYFTADASSFVLEDFIRALEVTPELSVDDVNEYERVLIELLTTIDDEATRTFITDKFETNEAKKSQWKRIEYGVHCVFDRAVKQGNVGLIRWLEPRVPLDRDAYDRAVIMAARAQQWSLVDYFCSSSTNQPQQLILKDLLNSAAKAGKLSTIQILCGGVITHLHKKNVEQALVSASIHGHRSAVQYLCGFEVNPPSATGVARALTVALQFERPEIIDFIGNLPENMLLLNIVERALIQAAMQDKLPIAQQLCRLITNAPRPNIVEEAFVKAIKSGHLTVAQYLSGLPVPLSQKSVDAAFAEAIANGSMLAAQYLCSRTVTPPSQTVVDQQLKQAVRFKHLDFVEYLCGLATTPPSQRAVEAALQAATKSGHLPIVVCLSRLVTPTIILETIQFAAKHGQLVVVQHCCTLNPPYRQAMFDARKKALASGHEEVANYFTELLARVPSSVAEPADAEAGAEARAGAGGGAIAGESAVEPVLTPSPPFGPLPEPVLPPALVLPSTASPPDGGAPLRRSESLRCGSRAPNPHLEATGRLRRSSSCGELVRIGIFGSRSGDRHVRFLEPIAPSPTPT